MMTEIGKFRTIAVADLARHRYPKEPGTLRQDLLNLKAQKLVCQRRVTAGKGQEKLSVLVLTREGKHLVQQEYRAAHGQSFYAGLVKPREVAHDAAIYRMYQVEAAEIEKRGGSVRRIVLDYELKKNVYKPLAKARNLPPLEYAKRQTEVAADNRLKVIDGRVRYLICGSNTEAQRRHGEGSDSGACLRALAGLQQPESWRSGDSKSLADRTSASRLNAFPDSSTER